MTNEGIHKVTLIRKPMSDAGITNIMLTPNNIGVQGINSVLPDITERHADGVISITPTFSAGKGFNFYTML